MIDSKQAHADIVILYKWAIRNPNAPINEITQATERLSSLLESIREMERGDREKSREALRQQGFILRREGS
jgi:hypothetical protein